jgi:hypothetical protein
MAVPPENRYDILAIKVHAGSQLSRLYHAIYDMLEAFG